MCVIVPNFAKIGRTVPEIWPIFDFSRWRPPPSWIWKFHIFNGWDAQEGRAASACQILSKSLKPRLRYGDFSFFQDGGRPPSWIFKSWKFQPPVPFGGPICVSTPNVAKIGQTVPEIWSIFDFSRWRPSAVLDWFYACSDHPRRVLGGLCNCAKFGGNRCRNFDSIQILIFCTLSLKMPIHASKIGFFGGILPPKWEAV